MCVALTVFCARVRQTKHLQLLCSVPLVGVSICRSARVQTELDEGRLLRLAQTVAVRVPTVKYVGLGFADICGKYRTEVQCTPAWFQRADTPPLLGLPRLNRLSREWGQEVEGTLLDMDNSHDRDHE